MQICMQTSKFWHLRSLHLKDSNYRRDFWMNYKKDVKREEEKRQIPKSHQYKI